MTPDTTPDAFRGSSGHSAAVRDRRGDLRDDFIDRAIRRLRKQFDPIKQELKDREYHMTRTQRRRRKDARALTRLRKKEKQKEYLGRWKGQMKQSDGG